MPSVPDTSTLRDLLEAAVPREPYGAATAAELRELGHRRARRSRTVGALIAVSAVSLSALGLVRYVGTSPAPVPPTSGGPSPRTSISAAPAPTPNGPDFAALTGTRWIPDLVGAGASNRQAYPDDTGNAPRALLTFGPGHVLVLDYIEKGRTTTVRGTWLATSGTPAVDARARGSLRLTLLTPAAAPQALVLLLNRMSLASEFAMFVPDGPPPSMAALTMSAYENATGVLILDLVKPGIVLPSPYPHRP